MRLRDRVALITGGGQGIGRATAERFAREGAIVVVADINVGKAQAVACEIGNSALALHLDVAQAESVDQCVATVIARYGRIDTLVNNAGITRDARAVKMTEEQFDAVVEVNL